jgi:uncharacterized protein (TIGR03382 family)
MRRVALGLTLIVMSGCGPLESSVALEPTAPLARAVTDGALATIGQVGATVALMDPSYGDNFCTGTLIAPRVVLSAAHCVSWNGELTQPDEVTIAAGVNEVNGAATVAVSAVVPHPDFGNAPVGDDPDGLGDDRDIAVLLLADDVSSASPTAVLPLDLVDIALTTGTMLNIAGFGMTSDDYDSADYGRLYIADTPYQRRSVGELLAGEPGTPDTCGGDSGGPAYVDYAGTRYVVGATSRAKHSGSGACGEGGIYTLVSAFDEWIDEVAGDLYTGSGQGADLPELPPGAGGGEDTGGSCASLCGGFDDTGACGCDPACKDFGDCCADFNDRCGDLAAWSCDSTAFADGVCDCGCGATDSDCAALDASTCERSACGDGESLTADLARCEAGPPPTADEPALPPDADPDLDDRQPDPVDDGPRFGGLTAELPEGDGCAAAGDDLSPLALLLSLGLLGRRRRAHRRR